MSVEGVIQKLHSVKYWMMISAEADRRNQKPHIKEMYKTGKHCFHTYIVSNSNRTIIVLKDIGF